MEHQPAFSPPARGWHDEWSDALLPLPQTVAQNAQKVTRGFDARG
jgi:hypothetical protein